MTLNSDPHCERLITANVETWHTGDGSPGGILSSKIYDILLEAGEVIQARGSGFSDAEWKPYHARIALLWVQLESVKGEDIEELAFVIGGNTYILPRSRFVKQHDEGDDEDDYQ